MPRTPSPTSKRTAIDARLRNGENPNDIATACATTPEYVRVVKQRMSGPRKGPLAPSDPGRPPGSLVHARVPLRVRRSLTAAARSRGMRYDELAAKILTTIARDGLYYAVLG